MIFVFAKRSFFISQGKKKQMDQKPFLLLVAMPLDRISLWSLIRNNKFVMIPGLQWQIVDIELEISFTLIIKFSLSSLKLGDIASNFEVNWHREHMDKSERQYSSIC